MLLLIPAALPRPRQSVPVAPLLGVSYGPNEVAGRRASPADPFQAVGRYRRSDVIRWIAAVSAWVVRDGALEPAHQLGMADRMLGEEYRAGLREAVGRLGWTRWCVSQRRQLRFLLQVALLAAREETPAADETALRLAVGECLRMATGVLRRIEPTHPIGETADAADRWTIGSVIPALDGRDRPEIAARGPGVLVRPAAGARGPQAVRGTRGQGLRRRVRHEVRGGRCGTSSW